MSAFLPTISEFFISVHDRGIPNQERVLIRPLIEVEMASYCLLLGLRDPISGEYLPLKNHFYWFGSGVAKPSQSIFVYTGPGTARRTTVQNTSDDAIVLHWGLDKTVLADSSYSPLLMKLGSMTVADPPALNLPQS